MTARALGRALLLVPLLAGCHWIFPHAGSAPASSERARSDDLVQRVDTRAVSDLPPNPCDAAGDLRLEAAHPRDLGSSGDAGWGSTPWSCNLLAVWGSAADHGWAVGAGGCMVHFEGGSWIPATWSGNSQDLHGVWGAAWNDVYTVGSGGTILHSNGNGWSIVSPPLTCAGAPCSKRTLRAISGSSASQIWAVGSGGTILHFNGVTWAQESSGVVAELYGVWASSSEVFAVGSNGTKLYRNSTGTWGSMSYVNNYALSAVRGSGSEVFTVGVTGMILRWDGTTWGVDPSGASADLYDVFGNPGGDFLAVGRSGIVLERRATVKQWSPVSVPLGGDLNAIWSAPGGPAIIVGSGRILVGRW